MRRTALPSMWRFIVVLLTACSGSSSAPTPSPAHPAPLSIYFSTPTLYALNARDGSVRWSQKTSQFPILENGVIYADAAHGILVGGVAAYNASDGKQRWFYRATGSVFITAVVNDVVYAAINSLQTRYGSMYALNARDGTVLWHAEQPQVVSGDAVVDGLVYATVPANPQVGNIGLAAFNAQNGTLLWRYQPPTGAVSLSQASNGHVYAMVSSADAPSQSYLSVLNANDGSVRWRYPQTVYAHLKELGVENGLVYLNSPDDATLYALRASDGSIRWRAPKGGGGDAFQALLTNDRLYVGLGGGTVYALDASDGSISWHAQVGPTGGSSTVPVPEVVGEGVVYAIRLPGGIYALNASDGASTWVHAEPPDDVWRVAAAMQGMVYVYTSNVGANTSTIDALNASDGSLHWSYQTGLTFDLVVG